MTKFRVEGECTSVPGALGRGHIYRRLWQARGFGSGTDVPGFSSGAEMVTGKTLLIDGNWTPVGNAPQD